jgi:DNA-binding transcriptional LysR family regulator
VDVGYVRPPFDRHGLEVRDLLTEPRLVVLPAGHPLAGRSALAIGDLAGEPLLQDPDAVPKRRAAATTLPTHRRPSARCRWSSNTSRPGGASWSRRWAASRGRPDRDGGAVAGNVSVAAGSSSGARTEMVLPRSGRHRPDSGITVARNGARHHPPAGPAVRRFPGTERRHALGEMESTQRAGTFTAKSRRAGRIHATSVVRTRRRPGRDDHRPPRPG